jgi:SAM-dependent methyltransferase
MHRTYLGTNLTPEQYYAQHSAWYSNPHKGTIEFLLEQCTSSLHSRILDLGCGPGLATRCLSKHGLSDFVGVDNAPVMVERYRRETGFPSVQANFWDELPKAECAVATHSIHLCPVSRLHIAMWRLYEAGVRTLLVISPLRSVFTYIPHCGVRAKPGPLEGAAPAFPHEGRIVWATRYEFLL